MGVLPPCLPGGPTVPARPNVRVWDGLRVGPKGRHWRSATLRLLRLLTANLTARGSQKTQCLCGSLRVYGSGDPSRCPWLPGIRESEANRTYPNLVEPIRTKKYFWSAETRALVRQGRRAVPRTVTISHWWPRNRTRNSELGTRNSNAPRLSATIRRQPKPLRS